MTDPGRKKFRILDEAEAEVWRSEQQYQSGLVTAGERYNKVVDIWSRTNEQVAKAMMGHRSTRSSTAKGKGRSTRSR